ncbi:MAG: hypothetical protein M5U12_22360 [Verrucomicrobia bacterium]|nr:hypothetical protein [Verrucomicrobiota bacterium]
MVSPDNWLAFRDAERWFRTPELTRLTAQTNVLNPFFTLHFQPPPPPAPGASSSPTSAS